MSTSPRVAASSATATTPADDDCASLCLAMTRGLEELAAVLRRLSDQQYVTPVAAVGSSPIGAHVRHCVDHVTKLVECVGSGDLDYDERRRGTAVETQRATAIAAIDELVPRVGSLAALDPQLALTVSAAISVDGPSVPVATTLGREIVFVLSHTIHHNAVIASLARAFSCELPAGFGWAPSTIRHAIDKPCAQ